MKQTDIIGIDVEQVRSLLGGADLRRVVERLRKRMSRGERLAGRIQLHGATLLERSAIDRLLGRIPTQGDTLTIDLDKVAAIFRHAKVCDRLEDAVTALVGPVIDERTLAQLRAELWDNLWRRAFLRVEGNVSAVRWIEHLQASGLLKRFAADDPYSAEALLSNAISVVEDAPYFGIPLAQLAASKTGNSHALDRGQPLAGLVIRFSRHVDDLARWKTAPQRRDAWETLGVLCDEVSAPVLVLNLRADSQSLTGQALNLHAESGEPYRVSVRQLRRHPPVFDPAICGSEVFVCENPTVVDVAANRLGASCRPIMCVDGQPKTAAHLLMAALTRAGIAIRYHGDFDWDGIRIANQLMRRHGATSWRFNARDYAAASQKEYAVKGTPVAAEWDDQLSKLMERVGRCVHEENVLGTLLADLCVEV